MADSRVNRVRFDVQVKREDFDGVHAVVQHIDSATGEVTEMSGTLQLYVTSDCEEQELSIDGSIVTAL